MAMPLDDSSDLPDAALLAAFARGDRTAARALTLRLMPRALAHATRLLGNRAEAEEVAQEAMLRLWRQAPHWRAGEARASTWLYRVVANLCIDRQRRARGGTLALDAVAEPPDPGPDAPARMQDRARAAALQAALMDLPARQRQAVALRHLEGLANPEIAAIMDTTTEAVESLTTRGRHALAAALAARKEELGYVDD